MRPDHKPPQNIGFELVPHLCRCPGNRRPPFSHYVPALKAIKDAAILNSSSPFGMHRCNECKEMVMFTWGDVTGGLRPSS